MTYKLEKVVKKQIKDVFNSLGIWNFSPLQNMGQGGIPDHIASMPVTITQDMVGIEVGIFIAVEAKSMSGKVSALQKIQLEAIADAKGATFLVRGTKTEPGNFVEFETELRALAGE